MNLLGKQRLDGCANTAPSLTINRIGGAIMANASNSESVEIWKPIPGWGGLYEASSEGRVRSLDKTINATSRWGSPQVYFRAGKVLKPKVDKDGYLGCHLTHAGRNKHYKVHQLVCMAFHGPAPAGCVVAHGDGARTNNRPDNLRWATTKENHRDRWRHGTEPVGAKHPKAKVTPRMAAAIRQRWSAGDTQSAISADIGISQTTIWKIIHGQHWTGQQ